MVSLSLLLKLSGAKIVDTTIPKIVPIDMVFVNNVGIGVRTIVSVQQGSGRKVARNENYLYTVGKRLAD